MGTFTPVYRERYALTQAHAGARAMELLLPAVSYRWKADEAAFAMPVRVGTDHWEIVRPTAQWEIMKTPLKRDEFQVATDLFYVGVSKL